MIDRGSPHTATAQLADILRGMIESAELLPGDAVPSEVQLSQRYGVSRGTARAAVAILRNEGRVRTHFGRGTFVADRSTRETVTLSPGDLATVEATSSGPIITVRGPSGRQRSYPAYEVTLGVPAPE